MVYLLMVIGSVAIIATYAWPRIENRKRLLIGIPVILGAGGMSAFVAAVMAMPIQTCIPTDNPFCWTEPDRWRIAKETMFLCLELDAVAFAILVFWVVTARLHPVLRAMIALGIVAVGLAYPEIDQRGFYRYRIERSAYLHPAAEWPQGLWTTAADWNAHIAEDDFAFDGRSMTRSGRIADDDGMFRTWIETAYREIPMRGGVLLSFSPAQFTFSSGDWPSRSDHIPDMEPSEISTIRAVAVGRCEMRAAFAPGDRILTLYRQATECRRGDHFSNG